MLLLALRQLNLYFSYKLRSLLKIKKIQKFKKPRDQNMSIFRASANEAKR